jgi:hypothetical protein
MAVIATPGAPTAALAAKAATTTIPIVFRRCELSHEPVASALARQMRDRRASGVRQQGVVAFSLMVFIDKSDTWVAMYGQSWDGKKVLDRLILVFGRISSTAHFRPQDPMRSK